MRDLEIRGAGNLLGAEQSGHIAAVGFDLYVEMVTEAVGELTATRARAARRGADRPAGTAHLPRDYIARDDVRMEAYRRLAAVTTAADVDDVRAEWADRYGPPPPPAAVLLDVARLRAECLRLGIRAVSVQKGRARLDGWELRKSQEVRLQRLSTDSTGPHRRRDRARRRDRRRVAPAGAPAPAPRDRSRRCGPGTLQRMKRPLSLLAAAPVIVLVAAGCGSNGVASTLNDAATVRYTVKGKQQTLHVTRDQLLSEVGSIVANKPFNTYLKSQKFDVDADLTTIPRSRPSGSRS